MAETHMAHRTNWGGITVAEPSITSDLLDQFAALVAEKITANLRNLPAQTPVKLYTVVQVAEMLNRSKSSVQHLIAKGELPSVRIGRRVQVEKEELERWIERQRN